MKNLAQRPVPAEKPLPFPVQFKVETDHADCLYRCGERASFTVTVTDAAGAPLKAGRFRVRLDNYGVRVFAEAEFDLANGNPFTISAAKETPGFMCLRLDADRDKFALPGLPGQDTFQWGVAYEPEKIRPGAECPSDFGTFWEEAVRKLDETVPADPQLEKVEAACAPGHDYFRVSFASYGGRRVWGWLNMPTGAGPFPVRVNVPGAGIGACGTTVSDDEITLMMNVHSYPQPDTPEAREAAYKAQDVRFAAPSGVARYCQAGIHLSREDYFYYASLLGINRAVNWLWAHPKADHADFTYSGTSQGGGFGLMLTGLNGHFTRSCIFVPAICDHLGHRVEGRESGWPKLIDAQRPENREAAARNAPYFDGASFATHITCPVRVVVGFSDQHCPPASGYAAYNCIPSADKAILHGIGMGHGVFQRFYDELGVWVRERSALSHPAGEGASWRPTARWCGFNLLGMFCQTKMAAGDKRICGYFPEDRFRWMREWGFNFARLPLDYRFFVEKDDWMKPVEAQLRKLDEAVSLGRRYGIHVQINFHRAPGYCCNPPVEPKSLFLDPEPLAAFTNLWGVLAKRYRGIPSKELSFDLVNEPAPVAPYGTTSANYAAVARAALAAIRAADPDRFVMSDGWKWGQEPVMELHPFDSASGESIHCYEPHGLTHYRVFKPDDPNPCPSWPPEGCGDGVEWLERNFVEKWRPAIEDGTFLHLGEFGCHQGNVPHATYLAWLEDALKMCERHGWGWALWNLDGTFGILDTPRTDCVFEDFNGHRLDRAALDLLMRYAG